MALNPKVDLIFFIEIDSCILGGTWRELIQLSKVQLFDLPTIYVLLCPHIKINQCYTEDFFVRDQGVHIVLHVDDIIL